jgi:hypothetical protein
MVTLSKSQTKHTRDRHKIARNGRHSQVVQSTLDNSGTMHLTSSCEMHRPKRVTHRFTKRPTCTRSTPIAP